MRIAHFADIHIKKRTDRHFIHKDVFEKTYIKLREQKPDRILIVGDLYHDFINLEGDAEILMGEFLNTLSNIAPVIITRGNHDMSKNITKTDVIETITTLINNPNVKYYDQSGFYEEDINGEKITWVVHHHGEGINPWNDILHIKDEDRIYIDLYHDPIVNCLGDNGQPLQNDKYKLTDLKGSFSMLGDIHLRQSFKNDRVWYCGSILQNSFGEKDVERHGYLNWNIIDNDNFSVEEVNIPNDFNYINLYIKKDYDYDNITLDNKYITPHSEIKVNWSDNVSMMGYENEIKIREYIKNKWNITKVKFDKDFIKTDMTESESINESVNLSDPNQQRKIFIEFLKLNKYDDVFIKKILEIDDKINESIVLSDNNGISFEINELLINNFKSYGDNIRINFDDFGWNKLIKVGGINQQGKTTFLEAICFALYGLTNNNKKMKFGDSKYINNKRNLDVTSVMIVITINNQKFVIKREINRKWNRTKTEISSCPTTVDYYKGTIDDFELLNDEQKKDTQKLIEQTIGTYDDFIRLSLTTADDLNLLISQDRSVFIDNLIRDMGIDIFEKKLEIFKEYKKDILSKRKNIDIDLTNSQIGTIKQSSIELSSDLTYLEIDIDGFNKDRRIKILEKENKISKLDKIDSDIENLNITDIEFSIETEESKINKNKDRLNLLTNLKDDIDNYDSSKLDKKQIEIDDITNIINEFKLKISNYDNEILKINNDIKHIGNDIKNETLKYTNNLISHNKDYNLEISKVKEVFGNHINEYTNTINIKLSKINTDLTNINNEINNLISEGKKLKLENDEIEQSTVCVLCKRELDGVDMGVIHTKVEHNKSEIEILRNQILELKPKSKELDDQSIVLSETINKIKLKDYSFDEELLKVYEQAKSDIKSFKDKIELNTQIKNNIDENNLPTELDDIIKVLSIKIDELDFMVRKIENDKVKLNTNLNDKNDELIVLKNELVILKDEKESIDKKREKVALEPRIQSEIEKSELNIDKYNKQIKEYNLTLDKIENNKHINKDISSISDEIEQLDNKITDKNDEISNIKSSIRLYENKLEQLEGDIILYNRIKKEDEVLSTYLKCVHRDGIPSFILKSSISDINNELTKLLIDVDFRVFFDDDLNLKLSSNTFLDINQGIMESSGKERTFTSIVLKVALRKLNGRIKPDILIFDEIMGKLTENSIVEFSGLLDTIKYEVGKLIIIEHTHPINNDGLIEVTKDDDGVSSLEIKY